MTKNTASDFHINYKIIIHLKCSVFWPSADVKPMSNDPVHAVTWQ